MAAVLPPMLLKYFTPRPPSEHWEPMDRALEKRKGQTISGIGDVFKTIQLDQDQYQPPPSLQEKKRQRMEKKRLKAELDVKEAIDSWDPQQNEKATSDPYKTLFVARLSYDTDEDKLRKEFDYYGPVKNVMIVRDQAGKSRGYGFVEFEKEKYMKEAYKEANGIRLDGRRILVDVERGRTVKGWRPRKLGGGLGSARAARKKGTKPMDRRPEPSNGYGGYRGGGGGGYRRDDRGYGGGGGGGGRYDRRDDRGGGGYGGGGGGGYGGGGGGYGGGGGGGYGGRDRRDRGRY